MRFFGAGRWASNARALKCTSSEALEWCRTSRRRFRVGSPSSSTTRMQPLGDGPAGGGTTELFSVRASSIECRSLRAALNRRAKPLPAGLAVLERTAADATRKSLPWLLQMAAAVDADGFTGDEIAVEQRQHGLRDLDFAAPAAERRRPFDRAYFFLARAWRREDRSGRDRVDEDVVGGQLDRERFGERDRAGLRDVIREVSDVPRPAAARDPVAEVDDA